MGRAIAYCVRRDLVLGRIYYGTLFSPFSRTYFAALAAFHSFLALKERPIQALTKTLYTARRSTRLLSFLLQRGGNHEARRHGGTLASFGYGCEPGFQVQCVHKQITNGTLITLKPSPHDVQFLRNVDLFDSDLRSFASPSTHVWPSRPCERN